MRVIGYFQLVSFMRIIHICLSESRISAEHRLYKDLFENYNTNIRPVRNENNTVQISLIFSLEHLDDLDAQKQLLRVSGWLGVEWKDEYLTWNESEYSGIDRIVVPPTRVWLPDFALDNSAGDVYDLKYYNFFRNTIYSDGTVTWAPGGKYECICTVDIAYYPFDNQICQVVFANWEYVGSQVNLTAGDDVINLDKYPGNGEWNLVKTEVVRYEDFYVCCPEDVFPELHFILYLQRRSLYYVINVLLPVLFLSLLELLIFILPCDSGEKISLGITIMLGFSVFALLIEESVPNTSEATPIIVIYLTAAMGTAAVSVVCSVIILSLHHHDCSISPPHYLMQLAEYSVLKKKCQAKKDIQTHTTAEIVHANGSACHLKDRPHYNDFGNVNLAYSQDSNYDRDAHLPRNGLVRHKSNYDITNLSGTLDYALSKLDEKERKLKIHENWKIVAKALDRLLFKIVAGLLCVMAIVILGIMPVNKTWPTFSL